MNDLSVGLGWSIDRVLSAQNQLRLLFLMPAAELRDGKTVLALNRNTRTLVLDVFRSSDALNRIRRQMQAASGTLTTTKAEENSVRQSLGRVRLLANQYRYKEAWETVNVLQVRFPARGDVLGTTGWLAKREERVTDAREFFKRAAELGNSDRDSYWHWSEMEAGLQEWNASAEAAELGLKLFPADQGLLFRKGYAIHRRGKECYLSQDETEGRRICQTAVKVLDQALNAGNAEHRNHTLLAQICRARVLNAETIGDGELLARCFADWMQKCPSDTLCQIEYDRIRARFPQYLRRH